MKKLLSAVILHALLLPVIKAQSKLFDQQVQLKTCNISIEANRFIATTFIEMEFYNPKDVEVEGNQNFELNRGQVVTAFQLELNGKYRDGSIEEKWKANRAYSSIVGKRVDPAILQMSYENYYRLNIYPIPPHGSRKVTMTIDQFMDQDSNNLNYLLPLNFSSATEVVRLKINVANDGVMPVCNNGLIKNHVFAAKDDHANLELELRDIELDKPISFSIPVLESNPQICISKQNGVNRFLVRLFPDVPRYYTIKPKTLSVFWDVSSSSGSRDIQKELAFLQQYILINNIATITITLFNQKILNTVVMDSRTSDFKALRNYLLNYTYSGATTFGNLDFSATKADAILVFSDGFNSFGRPMPKAATVQVNCIVSTWNYDKQQLENMIAATGGSIINLYETGIANAVKRIEFARNFLMTYRSSKLSVKLNEKFPIMLSNNILLSGTFEDNDDLQLVFGNSCSVNKVNNIYLSIRNTCSNALYDKVQMLKAYDSVMYSGDWQDRVYFGLKERVVTPQTSFLVLEKIEDYIKYNIAPPKDLEEECAERNYVYKSEYKIRALKILSEQDALRTAVNNYNGYVRWWDPKEEPIDLNKRISPVMTASDIIEPEKKQNTNTTLPDADYASNEVKGNTIKEVIVTSAFQTKRTLRSQTSNIQNISAQQLNTIREYDINNALAGKVAGLQVRSQSGVNLGRETIVRLRGENGLNVGGGPIYIVDGTIMPSSNDINPDDVEDVTVLQGPAATALFGPDGVNGAIVINSKRARNNYYSYLRWRDYKLKNAEDVEYMEEIKNSETADLWESYTALERIYKGQAGFYFDMADYFFERKLKDKAIGILFEGIESCRGDKAGLKAAAYIFEDWKMFNEAINIYQDLVERSKYDLVSKRDLALAYFQNEEYQKAVTTYYQIICNPDDDYYYEDEIKGIAMNEMNAIISLHRNCLDLSSMNLNLVKHLPVDLRITVECNYSYVNNLRITDGQQKEGFYSNYRLKNEGIITGRYWNYYNNINEYSVKKATDGLYKIKVDAYNYYSSYPGKIPIYMRLVIFKNFQKENQTMEVQHIVMDNQYGSVEVAEVKW